MKVMSKASCGVLALMSAFGMATAEAACKKVSTVVPFEVAMDMGDVTVDPATEVNAVIATKSFSIPYSGPLAQCEGSGKMIGVMLQGRALSNQVYATNVQGIGIRLSRTYKPGDKVSRWHYPHEVPAVIGSSGIGVVNFAPGNEFTVELIKTETVTGSGVLTEGIYTSYYGDGDVDADGRATPIMTTRVLANSSRVTTLPCSCKK